MLPIACFWEMQGVWKVWKKADLFMRFSVTFSRYTTV